MKAYFRAFSRFVHALVPTALLTFCQSGARPAQSSASRDLISAGSREIRRTVLAQEQATDLPGWETRLYLIEYPPGASAPPHVHPAVGVGYVLEGRFESAFEGESTTTVEQGQTFVDRSNVVHSLFRNPDPDRPLKFLIAYTIRRGEPPLRAASGGKS
jgi:quercetin dioxygenase-like cupin family protein